MSFDLNLNEPDGALKVTPKRKKIAIAITILGAVVLSAVIWAVVWYNLALRPVSDTAQAQVYKVTDGETISSVGTGLEQAKLIRSELAFVVYMRLNGGNIRSGTYHLSSDMKLPDIVAALLDGEQSSYDITFYPGATLTSPDSLAQSKRVDVTTQLKRAGFSAEQIATALKATYDSPLFADKPHAASLEGYIFGDTYNIASEATAEDILQLTFDTFWQRISSENIPSKIKSHGLDLYQGITLASIVQQEAPDAESQRQIAQVFYSRMAKGMMLGSDVTFIYAANKLGVPATPDLNSPYNTRIHTGLPPGPIASPSLGAMEAVANPAKGDYLYFVAGDDGKIYYARTNAEHESNVAKYCTKLCQ